MNFYDPALQRDLNNNGVEFLSADIDTALTFTQIAADRARDPETRERNRCNARKAYETVLQLSGKINFKPEQQVAFEHKVAVLKQALLQLGERF